MDRDPQLHALTLGTVLVLLRERRKLRQAELAERAGVPPSTLSRIESGQGHVGTHTLGQLAAPLGVEPSSVLALVEDVLHRAEKAARQTLRIPAAGWWRTAHDRIGPKGAGALVTFAVAAVLAEQP